MTRRTSRMLYHDRAMKQSKTSAMNILLHLIEQGSDFLLEKHQRSLLLWEGVIAKESKLTEEKDPDRFVPVCDVEKYLRKNFLSIVFNSTARYGNKEVERIYSWKEGTIGPMNTLLNRAGAQLRFLAMTRYPFPLPTKRYVRRIKKVKKRRKYKEYERSGSLSMMSDYGLQFYLKREGERSVMQIDFHGSSDINCELNIGDGGFFEDCASRI